MTETKTRTKWTRYLFRLLIALMAVVIFVLAVVYLAIKTPWGNQKVKELAVDWLEKKLKTNVSVGRLDIHSLSTIGLYDVMLKDRTGSTMLHLDTFQTTIDLGELLKKNIDVSVLKLSGLEVRIHRDKAEPSFNYQFLIDAFSSTEPQPEPVSEAGKPWTVQAKNIDLSQVHFLWDDEKTTDRYDVSFTELHLPIRQLDLDRMAFKAGDAYINDLVTNIRLGLPEEKKKDSSSSRSFSIALGKLTLNNTRFQISDQASGLLVDSKAGQLMAGEIFYDLDSLKARAKLFVLEDHQSIVEYRSSSTPPDPGSESTSTPFSLAVDSVAIVNTRFRSDNTSAPVLPGKQFDPNHIKIDSLDLYASSLSYRSNAYAANIRQLHVEDGNGFTVAFFKADLHYSDTSASVKNLSLVTKKNRLNGSLQLSYPSMAEMMKTPGKTMIRSNINSTTINLDELTYFQPSLKSNKQLNNVIDKNIDLSLAASGTLADLELSGFSIRTGNNLLKGSARLLNISNPSRMDADLKINELASTRQSLKELLPAGLVPDSAWRYIPDRFTLKGRLDVSQQRVFSDLVLSSSIGGLTVKGHLDNYTDKTKAGYDLYLRFKELALGKLLTDSSYGLVTGSAHISGKGFDLPTMQAEADANIENASYNGIDYNQVTVTANTYNGKVSANLQSDNPGVDLDADIAFAYREKLRAIKVNADVRNLDLFALGLMDSVFVLKGKIEADFPVVDTSRLEGNAMITGVSLQAGSRMFPLDSLTVNAVYDSIQHLDIHSDLADIQALGKFSFPAIPRAGKQIFNNWLHNDSTKQTYSEVVIAVMLADVHIPDSLAPLIPGLKSIGPFKLNASVNTNVNQMFFAMQVPYIEYGDYKVDSLNMSLFQSGNYTGLKVPRFGIEFNKLQAPKFILNHTEMTGSVYEGELITVLKLMDQKGKEKYSIPITYHHDDTLPFVFFKDTIILNSTRWNVNEDNRIYLNTEKLGGSNLSLSKAGQSISVKANETNQTGYPLEVSITDFQLETLSSMALSASGLVEGKLNGKFVLTSQTPLAFHTDVKIDSLGLLGKDIGNLETHLATDNQGKYNINLTITENGNDMKVDGFYDGEKKEMDIHAVMKPFNISPFGFLLESYVDSFSGGLMGDVRISGSTDKPVFNGNLELDSAGLILRQTGAKMSVSHARFKFNERDIEFDGLDILDSAGNKARVTGTAIARDLSEVSYDLKMDANKFLVAGRRRYEEQLVSGPLWASMALKLKGDLTELNIDGSVKVLDSSVVTYVYRKEDEGIDGEGLIEFFDPSDSTQTDSTAMVEAALKRSSSINLNINTYITLTPASTVCIVLDEFTGDQVKVKGDANLNFTIAKGMPMELIGAYKVESGTYNLSIGGIIKKEFDIQKGSTINWSGDLLKAKTDLTALYKIKTDAEELVQDNETVKGAAKQKLNFEVYLNIKGELLQPVITFKLDMPSNDQAALDGAVYTRIRQINTIPSELNKQVMGLLALNSFIADNPFSSLSGGGSMETTAFSTVGGLLSQELNDFLGDMIKDVDIDVGLDIRDDYTTGSAKRRSDLNVALTKSFANNRLVVYVGNTFALEDQNQQTDLLSGLAGDVSMEYMLTTDGRYRLRGYRETRQDLTFNGMVVETGATFVVVVEFNKLKNAFRNRSEKRKQAKSKT